MKRNRKEDLDEIARKRRRGFFAYVGAAILITLFMWGFEC